MGKDIEIDYNKLWHKMRNWAVKANVEVNADDIEIEGLAIQDVDGAKLSYIMTSFYCAEVEKMKKENADMVYLDTFTTMVLGKMGVKKDQNEDTLGK